LADSRAATRRVADANAILAVSRYNCRSGQRSDAVPRERAGMKVTGARNRNPIGG